MKPILKMLTIFSCALHTVYAAQSPEEKNLTAPPSPVDAIETATAPVPEQDSQFPDPESESVSPALLPVAPNNSPAELSLDPAVPQASDAQKRVINEFISGFSTVMSKTSDAHGQNVHDLDVFMQAHIPTHLIKILQEVNIGENTLTKEKVTAILKAKAPAELRYENKKIPQATVHGYIDKCVTQAFTQAQTQELFSRYVEILISMDDQDHYNTLLNSIAENYATGGGCWPGVRNRCAISLAYLVAHKIDAL